MKQFHNEYESIANVTGGRSATAVLHDYSTVYILIFNKALLFGKLMDHLLVNPNQIRSFGIPVSDKPFNKTREFGIDHK